MAKGCVYITPNTFRQFPNDAGLDQMYLDGVSITLERRPQKHILMYAVGRSPNFVGNHFYYETAATILARRCDISRTHCWMVCGVLVEACSSRMWHVMVQNLCFV